MVSKKEIRDQLKKIGFSSSWWNKSEIAELPNIILPGEEIYECVNGSYEGGLALLVATDIRVLLIDKKPLNYLTVEDMRFDMISQMDYSHRMLGANIKISAGDKTLRFRSVNQTRLRKLIGHVQHCMAASKRQQSSHQDNQASHLEQINKQLGSYLASQQQYQQQLQQYRSQPSSTSVTIPEPPKPSNELADYLYAQSLLNQYNTSNPDNPAPVSAIEPISIRKNSDIFVDQKAKDSESIYNEAIVEVFGNVSRIEAQPQTMGVNEGVEVNAMQIAYSKLPTAMRDKKFGNSSMQRPAAYNVS